MSDTVFLSADLTPTEILAADSAEFIVRITIGPGYTSAPSRIIFDLPGTLGMSRPNRLHTEENGFAESYVSNPHVQYQTRVWDMEILDFPTRNKGSWRGMAARMVVLDLSEGLTEGDTIEMHWGDTREGFGPGTKATSVVPRPNYECAVHIRYFDNQDEGLPDLGRSFEGYTRPQPTAQIELPFRVLPREPHHLRLIRKVDKALLLPHDMFYNVAEDVELGKLADITGRAQLNDFNVYEYANQSVAVKSRGLPMTETPAMHDAFDGYNIYWGDIHTHSAFSNDCIEREKMDMSPADLMCFAQHRAGLDFYACTDHHQPWDKPRNQIGRERWEETLEAIRTYHSPGELVIFPGIEFRCKRGDTAVVFNRLPEYDEIARPEWTDIRALWKGLEGKDYLSIPHFHNLGGLEGDEWWENIDTGIEPVLEIYSCHGSYERAEALEHRISMSKRSRPERYGAYFIERGLRYGFVGNSDGHKGHVGSSGVTAVFAKSLDRRSILEAYRKRRVYATTNARMRMVFTANGQLMGSVVPNTSSKELLIDVEGENTLKKIEVFRNAKPYRMLVPEGKRFREELKIDDNEPSSWYVRATQVDNHIAFSSPIWFE